ncbi:RTM1-like protein [Fusarium heterosporum]|uniref:RTM1-like protein n=1 Tax=Fusarium heterosporum TaxID=42747 RepID=A0A8H5TKB2_FUSHE|nr:RTM1-like protein [Fusarium heterosporum]
MDLSDTIAHAAVHLIRAEAPQSENTFKMYHYHPTEVGAIVFVLLFLVTTLAHTWQLFRYRVYFVIPIIVGGICKYPLLPEFDSTPTHTNLAKAYHDARTIVEIIGYAARYASGKETPNWTLTPYIIQAILLLVAPALFAATIYMELGRIITLVDGEGLALISRKWMTKIFVIGDVLSFVLQGGGKHCTRRLQIGLSLTNFLIGGGYQSAGSLSALRMGTKIIIIGLFVQLAFFGAFLVVAVKFHINIVRRPTTRSRIGIPWRKHLKLLYGSGILIMVRSIFRAIEYLQGDDGYLLAREGYLYVFDALLMFVVMVLFNIIHPAELFVDRSRIAKFATETEIGLRDRV